MTKRRRRLHLEHEIDRLQAGGLSFGEARLQAIALFGGVEHIKEECRDARGTAAWEALLRDSRQATRRLMRDWFPRAWTPGGTNGPSGRAPARIAAPDS